MADNLWLLSVSNYSRNLLGYLNKNLLPVSFGLVTQRLQIQFLRQRRIHGEKDAGNGGGANVYGEAIFVRPDVSVQQRRAVPYNTTVANIDDIWLRDEDIAKMGKHRCILYGMETQKFCLRLTRARTISGNSKYSLSGLKQCFY